ncbi:DUF6093 family protein [Actinoallomurus sp. CA-142502]|uniref:DUF6093 family protein n=1 Tax=Actinoallomurus sp. CA-142502 TaxID=3239885 RepID=UPI003D8A567B
MPLQGRGSRVIDPRWSNVHRPTATATMNAECVITHQTDAGTTDGDGNYTPGNPATLYAGPCRVLSLSQDEAVDLIGEAQETHHRYRVSISYDAVEIPINASVHITLAPDAGLVGKAFRVISVAYGSEQWQRDLVCDERED